MSGNSERPKMRECCIRGLKIDTMVFDELEHLIGSEAMTVIEVLGIPNSGMSVQSLQKSMREVNNVRKP